MRGQHFGFLCVLCAAWISTRVAVLSFQSVGQPVPAVASVPQQVPERARSVSASPATAHRVIVPNCCQAFMRALPLPARFRRRVTSLSDPALPLSSFAIAAQQAASAPFSGPSLWPQAPAAADPQNPRRLQVYAYHFWRDGGGSVPLGTGRYGGGQSGVIATYRIAPDIALLARAAVAHDGVREREIAAGVRWSPLQSPELTLTAEHRLRNAGSHSVAVYAAGGKSAVPLPLDFKLDTYGQAGFVSGRSGGVFFDAQARADRAIVAVHDVKLRAGGGIWAGGQKGIARLDIGPTISSTVDLGDASIRVDADWRFRVAGDARPASGPAITLSTSF